MVRSFSSLLSLMLIGCVSVVPGEGMDFDMNRTEMRHGWRVFTGAKRTQVGVNDQTSIDRGKELYMKNCKACHGPKGEGDGPVAKAKGITPANLRNLSRKAPNYYMFMQIQEGKNEMPKWKDILTPKQSWDITNYIQSLGQQ